MDKHHKLENAIANLSSKYQEDVGELTYHVAQEAKRCGFEVSTGETTPRLDCFLTRGLHFVCGDPMRVRVVRSRSRGSDGS